jgi:hypothetical protein
VELVRKAINYDVKVNYFDGPKIEWYNGEKDDIKER